VLSIFVTLALGDIAVHTAFFHHAINAAASRAPRHPKASRSLRPQRSAFRGSLRSSRDFLVAAFAGTQLTPGSAACQSIL
jgi:hypothetical protein